MNPRGVRLAALLLAAGGAARPVVAGAPPSPSYALQVAPAQTIDAEMTLDVRAPLMRAEEWIVFAAQAPDLPGQRATRSVLEPAGSLIYELSPLHRGVLMARVPLRFWNAKDAITIKVRYQATLLSRHLAALPAGAPSPAVAPDLVEQQSALAAGSFFDFESAEFQAWLSSAALRRNAAESDLDYARRVFLHIKRSFGHEFLSRVSLRASFVCRRGRSDCGGLSVLFASAMRAHGIPARVLLGRWAASSQPGERVGEREYFQEHAKAEFYARGVGWVPVDQSAAIQADRSPEGLQYFGHDAGDFLTMHVDFDLLLDTVHFGQQTIEWMQQPAYWVTGSGYLARAVNRLEWKVTAR